MALRVSGSKYLAVPEGPMMGRLRGVNRDRPLLFGDSREIRVARGGRQSTLVP